MAGQTEAGRRRSGGLLKETKMGVRMIRLLGRRLDEATDLLARCFHNTSLVAHFPDERARFRALPRMFAARLRDALGFGHVYAATREIKSSDGDELVGVTVWLPPGAFPLSPGGQLRVLPGMAGVLAAAPRSACRLLRYTAGIARLHPAQPYWYLEVVGVDPAARGLGIGTRLLEPILAQADKSGQPCYL
jgi:GNAT superfamily N-acetyltransferase